MSTPPYNNSSNSSHQDISANLLAAAAQASAAQESSEESGADDGSPDAQKPEKRRKRARACVACRNMKIRCNPVEGQDACLACSKVNRECIMPGPAKKRQKTVHKVAELEKRINALTQSLLAKNQAIPTPSQSPAVADGSRSTKETLKDSPEERSYSLFGYESPVSAPPSRNPPPDSKYEDVLDRGIISSALANQCFETFVSEMNPLCPMVAFPRSTTLEDIRGQRPMLSLAILASASPSLAPESHEELSEELARQLSNRIYFLSERSLDLIQASLIHTNWVGKHRSAKDLGFNIHIHCAIVMAHDMGISKRLKTPLTRNPTEEAEMRRTWLSCYYSAIAVAGTLRLAPMVRNTPHIQDCLKFLASSPAALPTDSTLCGMVRLIQVIEDVSSSFHMDDPASVIRLEDSSTQYSLKLFERRMEDWRTEALKHMNPKLVNLLYATGTVYSHEIALHTDHNVDDFRPPAGRPGASETETAIQDFITPSHLDALTKAVVAMRSTLDAFLDIFPTSGNRAIPCLLIVWTAYAVVCMIRLDGALRASNSRYTDIFSPDLKIEDYLDRIINRLNRAAAPSATNPRSNTMLLHAYKETPFSPASNSPVPMFHQAFQKLRVWYRYRLVGAIPPEQGGPDTSKVDLVSHANKQNDYMTSTMNAVDSNMGGVDSSVIGTGPVEMLRQQRMRHGGQSSSQYNNGAVPNAQGFDINGGSWLTNSGAPIDASMFENQDWNFTFEDWGGFEASMVQPAGGAWLGYLL